MDTLFRKHIVNMSTAPQIEFSYDEYLACERTSQTKSEFYAGQIFAMSGGTPRHNTIGVNLVLPLPTVAIEIPLADIYEDVVFGAE